MYRHATLALLLGTALLSEAQTPTPSAQTSSSVEYYQKGNELRTQKKYADAVVAYKNALAIDPKNKEARYELGWCQNELKEYNNAITTLRNARELWPTSPRVFFELAYAFEKTNNTDSAIANYNRCLDINTSYSGAYRQLGYIAYNKEEYNKALEYFKSYEE